MFESAMNFETYIEKANSAHNKEDLFNIYKQAVGQHGLDRVLLCLATDHSDIGEQSGTNFMHNYPEDWMKHYFQNGYDQIDPVMIYSLSQIGSYKWDDIPKKMNLMKKQKECLNLGEESGLYNGICTPLRGPQSAIAGLSLASSEKIDAFDGNIDIITAYSNHFYLAYRRLGQKFINKAEEVQNYALTDRERDILCWIAKGKSQTDIGVILNISHHTVNYHMRTIFGKLGVNDKILAVVKAITYGLINP